MFPGSTSYSFGSIEVNMSAVEIILVTALLYVDNVARVTLSSERSRYRESIVGEIARTAEPSHGFEPSLIALWACAVSPVLFNRRRRFLLSRE